MIELMAVVVITGILAIAGVSVFRKYILSSKGAEATSVIQALRSAEEAYLAENHVYLDVSTGANWYPRAVPNRDRVGWKDAPNPDLAKWQALAPAVARSVSYSYLVNAGIAGQAIPAPQNIKDPQFAVPTQSWYLIQAEGDSDSDGVFANYASTSMTGEIYSEREAE